MAPNHTVDSHMPVGSVEFMMIQPHGCMHKSILQRMENLKLLNKINTTIRDDQIPRRPSQSYQIGTEGHYSNEITNITQKSMTKIFRGTKQNESHERDLVKTYGLTNGTKNCQPTIKTRRFKYLQN